MTEPRGNGWYSFLARSTPERSQPQGVIVCSFCGRSQSPSRRVIAGPTPAVAICEDCVRLCVELFDEVEPLRAPDDPT